MKKIIFFGLASLIFFALFELFSFSILKIYSKFNTTEPQIKITSGYKYIEAKDIPEKKNYHAFYGWRGYYSDNKFKVRQTLENKKWNNKSYIYFFGGSTVLGAGTTFDKTIPSHFANLNHYFQPINMGEHSYVSRQSLNRLIEIIDEIKKNDIVIFYEGVNDVVVNCQKNLGVNGHSRVSEINKLVKNQNNSFNIL